MTITINPKDEQESEKVKAYLVTNEVEFVENEFENDWWDEIADAEKLSIERGLEDSREGKTKPHSEARKVYGKYL
ncbi:hypothetical protein [Frigoriflavimonas asaccharolytica]|uniref:Uncharacterized protein n=1 Tax=Frigoriflavimonas asaccharolytica TaxID=2735899 RepID=A0A8J8GCG1_9FLAO|nr:hypothetical protein [Frigoriflavimonas asaccharolytica]NRS93972.1 hypothetical protein [Frigoriflavimonas asaccharolytica]